MNKHSVSPSAPFALRIGVALALALAGTLTHATEAAAAPQAKTSAAKPAARQSTFESPQTAVDALVAALRQQDAAAMQRILGPDSRRIVDSGDAAADRAAWAKFVTEYDAKHTIQMEGDSKAVVNVGASDWPMPIPLVKGTSGWVFDTAAGAEELLDRRIGRNELDAIQVCLAFVDMEREYAELDRNGDGTLEYAARLVSTPGKHDGLYWPTKAGEPPSPAGPRLAAAHPQPRQAGSAPKPFHGYYYRILTKQGPHAPGGARDYSVKGRLIGGIALVAWPASYMSSGVKTFMCSLDGKVLEKDLGPKTSTQVTKITAFDPDPGWTPAK